MSRGIRSLPILKCSSERWVCAPHSLSAGTSTTPRLSVSVLISTMDISWVCCMKLAKDRAFPRAGGHVSLSDVVDLEHGRGFSAGVPAGGRGGLEINAVGRNDRL